MAISLFGCKKDKTHIKEHKVYYLIEKATIGTSLDVSGINSEINIGGKVTTANNVSTGFKSGEFIAKENEMIILKSNGSASFTQTLYIDGERWMEDIGSSNEIAGKIINGVFETE